MLPSLRLSKKYIGANSYPRQSETGEKLRETDILSEFWEVSLFSLFQHYSQKCRRLFGPVCSPGADDRHSDGGERMGVESGMGRRGDA